jgi:short-subunit dehydrogenase
MAVSALDPEPPAAENVVIFGATSAIAAEVAQLYAERGARLHLVARNPEKLAQVPAR